MPDNTSTIFVGYPWAVYRNREAYKRAYTKLQERFAVRFVFAEDRLSTKHVLEKITDMIDEADLGIFDVTAWNANVTLEYGLANGLGKPAFIAFNPEKTDLDDVPADVRGFDRLQYSDFDDLSERLAGFLESDFAGIVASAPRTQSRRVSFKVDLQVRRATIAAVDLSDQELPAWQRREKERLLGSMDDGEDPNHRSKAQYEAEVNTYLSAASKTLRQHLRAEAVRIPTGLVSLVLQNHAEDNLSATVVELELPEGVEAFFGAAHAAGQAPFPRAPAPWGIKRRLLTSGTTARASASDNALIDNYLGCRVEFPALHLRPGSRQRLRSLYLVVDPEHAGGALQVSWRVTTRSASGWAEGVLSLPVTDLVIPGSLLTSLDADARP